MNDILSKYNDRLRFEPANNYHQLHRGAHRKTTTPIDAPSLVAHFAFWQEASIPAPESSTVERDKKQNEWTTSTEEYIRAIFLRLSAKEFKFNTRNADNGKFDIATKFVFLFNRAVVMSQFTGKEPNRNKEKYGFLDEEDLNHFLDRNSSDLSDENKYSDLRYQTVNFDFTWNKLPVNLRFEKHQEHLSITAVIDVSVKKQDDSMSEITINFEKFIEKYRSYDGPKKYTNGQPSDEDNVEWRSAHEYLYETVWDEFLSEILLPDIDIWAPENLEHPKLVYEDPKTRKETERKITSIRDFQDGKPGLGYLFADFRGLVLSPTPPPAVPDPVYLDVRPPHWRSPDTVRERLPILEFDTEEAYKCIKMFEPFVICRPPELSPPVPFTACYMLDRRVIYMSALGVQPRPYQNFPSESYTVNSAEKRQHSPVYFLVHSKTYNPWQNGRLVENMLRLGVVRVAAIQKLDRLLTAGRDIRELKDSDELKVVNRVKKELVEIDNRFKGGLGYRIERSRYYVKQFKDGLSALRIRRIEGFQPYGEFVLGRLDATFDYIDRLGIRLERLKRNLDTSAQIIYATSQNALTERLVSIQETGEIILWLFFIPYYSSTFLDHTIEYFIPNRGMAIHLTFHKGWELLLCWPKVSVILGCINCIILLFCARKVWPILKKRRNLDGHGSEPERPPSPTPPQTQAAKH